MSALRRDPLTLAEAARIMRAYKRAHRHQLVWLYAFQVGAAGPVKIGISGAPNVRLATLQRANAETLHPLATWRGFPFEERQLHEEFADARLQGEWFRPVPRVLALAEQYGDDYDGWDE